MTLPKMTIAIAATALAIASFGVAPTVAQESYKFALSLGWSEGESGQHLLRGFKDGVESRGGSITVADASYDPKRQSDQIDAFIKAKPDALFVTASDPAAIAPAVIRAIDAGIPVFAADSLIPGALVTTTAMSNNYGMGAYMLDFIAAQIGGKGKIAMIDLPANETWDLRALGMYWRLQQYPDIEVVGKWSYNSTGATTPRQGADGLITANPDIDAIWGAWDGAAIGGALSARAAGKDNIFTVGIDGGKQVFNAMIAAPDSENGKPKGVALSMAQAFYEMAAVDVFYAYEHLAGNSAPRVVITPVYAVTQDMLNGKEIPDTYDVPGEAEKLGWERVL